MGIDAADSAYASSDIFSSFFMAGFECSSHRRRSDRRRLDLVEATDHHRTAFQDFQQLNEIGLRTVREGLRWHLIERLPLHFDWSSLLTIHQAASESGVQVIWDLFHYGWPDGIDIFSPAFVDRFARFSAEAAKVILEASDGPRFYCPVNEISYFAWCGGQQGLMNPFARNRGPELKRQLVRAAIAAMTSINSVDPRARFVHIDPAIHVVPLSPNDTAACEAFRAAQFEALDMICGRREQDLGGRQEYLDIIGLNYYPDNQWWFKGGLIPLGHYLYRPLRELLQEYSARYGRPMIVAETGAEGTARPSWLNYVSREVLEAKRFGANLQGICLYPITDYPGWENGRLCETGLLQAADPLGKRNFYGALLAELQLSAVHFRGPLS